MQRKEHKWLLRKVSGSRGRYSYKPDYNETRHKKYRNVEDSPKREGMGKGHSFLDTLLVKRWLYKQVGKNFDEVYSDFLTRIQPKYKDEYKDCIYDYVDLPNKSHSEERLKNSTKSFFICHDNNELKRYTESEIKKRKIREKENLLGKFYFCDKEQIWESTGHPKLTFKEYLEDKQIIEIQELLKKKEKIELKAIAKINEFAETHKIKQVINGRKILLKIDFVQVEKVMKFDLYFEIVGIRSKNWIVSFSEFSIINIEAINH